MCLPWSCLTRRVFVGCSDGFSWDVSSVLFKTLVLLVMLVLLVLTLVLLAFWLVLLLVSILLLLVPDKQSTVVFFWEMVLSQDVSSVAACLSCPLHWTIICQLSLSIIINIHLRVIITDHLWNLGHCWSASSCLALCIDTYHWYIQTPIVIYMKDGGPIEGSMTVEMWSGTFDHWNNICNSGQWTHAKYHKVCFCL